MIKRWTAACCVFAMMLTACGAPSDDAAPVAPPAEVTVSATTVPSQTEALYVNITPEEAKQLMDTETDYVIVDVRTQSEYDAGHIAGAVLLPYDEVAERASAVLPQKDRMILVYCRSGRRSKIAAEALQTLGYTDIREFGGIIDWPYEITQ